MTTGRSNRDSPHRTGGRRLALAGVGLFAVCALLRVGLADRQGLWADELFSLAMATGHSLEHPAAAADAARGDFVEAARPLPPAAYSRYLEHEEPAAGPDRVVRAVLLSDTSPPLYYLLLYGWTRAVGTGDAALRLFSVTWALACFPVLWSLARQVGGPTVPVPVALLFTFAPVSVCYSTEGRMYALLWFWTACLMWFSLKRWRHGARPALALGWVAASVAGFLTHYFFAFVWAAALGWLLLHPGRSSRKAVGAAAVLVGVLAAPWYARLPASLATWRITMNWLNERPGGYHPVQAFLQLPWSFLSVRGVWGGSRRLELLALAVVAVLAWAAWRRLGWSFFTPRRQLLWGCLAGACLGPAVFDGWRGTYVTSVPRYALAGMPAMYLVVGLGLGRLPLRPRAVFLALLVLVLALGVVPLYRNDSRTWEPTRQVGQLLAERAGGADLVIVHSIPSGVAGVARYLEAGGASAQGVGFASWVGQLGGRRVPDDLRTLAAGRKRIFLVEIHAVGEPAPEEAWLREHARLAGRERLETATVLVFVSRDATTFFPRAAAE